MADQTPAIFLRDGLSLKGKDMLLVVKRVQASPEEHKDEDYASFSKRHFLTSYSSEELDTEFRKFTGYDIKVKYQYSRTEQLSVWQCQLDVYF